MLFAFEKNLPIKPWSQVVASSGKLNLRRDLRWVAKRIRKFPRKLAQIAKKKHFKANKGSVPRSENVTTRIKANKMEDIVDVVDRKRKAAACLGFVLLREEDDGISLADNRLIDVSHLALTCVDLGWVSKR